jgi:hypothetical protein
MNLEFKVYQLKPESKMYKSMIERTNANNEFVIVGEEKFDTLDCYKAHQVENSSIPVLADLKIDYFALFIAKNELELKGDMCCEILEFDIPKKNLTIDIIENIKRLNG